MEYDLKKIENKISIMSTLEKDIYLNNLIYDTEKKLIEIQENSFEHLKNKTQNDYIKYLDAFDNGELIYWYSDKVEVNGKNLNDTTAERFNIENHKLLRKRLKIENEIKRLNDRKKLFINLLEHEKTNINNMENKVNYIDVLFNHNTSEQFLIEYIERVRKRIDISDAEFIFNCNRSIEQVKILFKKSQIEFKNDAIFNDGVLFNGGDDYLINSQMGFWFSAKKVILIEKILIKYEDSINKPAPSELLITTVERTRLIELHTYLLDKYIDVDIDSWLYWFSKQTWTNKKMKPANIKWIGAVYHLPNVVYLICGNMEVNTETAMKKAFKLPSGKKFQKLTKDNIKGDFYTNIKNKINWAERYAIE